jgi:hypothetical protein
MIKNLAHSRQECNYEANTEVNEENILQICTKFVDSTLPRLVYMFQAARKNEN